MPYSFQPGSCPPTEYKVENYFYARDRLRQTIAAVLGGIALIITFVWSFEKDRAVIKEGYDEEAARQFGEDVKLLGDGSIAARAGGAYGLIKIAEFNSSYEIQVRNTLAAFILASDGKEMRVGDEVSYQHPLINADVQSAVDAIGNRPLCRESSANMLNLDNAYLRGAKALFSYGFRNTYILGSKLQGSDFRCADLSGTQFSGTQSGDYQAYAKWTDAVPLSPDWGEWHKFRFIVRFGGANLTNAVFIGADLSGATFEFADLKGTNFKRAHLSRADFKGARNLTASSFFVGSIDSACADEPPRWPDGFSVKLRACTSGSKQTPLPQSAWHNDDEFFRNGDLSLCHANAPPSCGS